MIRTTRWFPLAALAATLLAAASPAFAADLTFDSVAADSLGAPLPAGTVKYQVLQSTNGGPYGQVGEVTTNAFTRKLSAGKYSFVVTATFTPDVPDGTQWTPSLPSDPVSLTIAAAPKSPARVINVKIAP